MRTRISSLLMEYNRNNRVAAEWSGEFSREMMLLEAKCLRRVGGVIEDCR